MPIRVLIADDHEVVRIGLRSMFAGTDVEVVAEVGTGNCRTRAKPFSEPGSGAVGRTYARWGRIEGVEPTQG